MRFEAFDFGSVQINETAYDHDVVTDSSAPRHFGTPLHSFSPDGD